MGQSKPTYICTILPVSIPILSSCLPITMEGNWKDQSIHWYYESHALSPSHQHFLALQYFLLSWILFIIYTYSNHSHVKKNQTALEVVIQGTWQKNVGILNCVGQFLLQKTIISHTGLLDRKKERIYSFIEGDPFCLEPEVLRL